ncbi:hypothetical protein A8B75_04250 [Sphingomonadales bacterium EhC05]|nr:hypothetical protein A8B75_04250 [Sphingomonadales bacterium EhC05]
MQSRQIAKDLQLAPRKRGNGISVNPEIAQFVRLVDNLDDECLIVFGKDQLLRVRGSLEEVTDILRDG